MQHTLTAEQLAQIEAQVTEHGGSQYLELHIEFCDHLSTAIEAAWASGSEENFEVLLAREIRKFGYAGFTVLSKNKEKDVNKKYKDQAWQLFKDWWVWPKMFISLAVGVFIYMLFTSIDNFDIRQYLFGALSISGYVYIVPMFYKHWMTKKQQKREILAMKMVTEVLVVCVILFNASTGLINSTNGLTSNWVIGLYAILQVSFWIVAFYIAPLMFRESWAKAEGLALVAE